LFENDKVILKNSFSSMGGVQNRRGGAYDDVHTHKRANVDTSVFRI